MEELVFNNYLMDLKSTVEVYVHGTLESSNESIRTLLKKGLDETMECQARTYDKMVENNWYNIENVESKSIKKVVNNLNK